MSNRQKFDALWIAEADNTATMLRDAKAGERVSAALADGSQAKAIVLQEDIGFGHKFALADIGEGQDVLKYGEVIGRTHCSIHAGQHVHVHNVESLRGRGDETTGRVEKEDAQLPESFVGADRLVLKAPLIDVGNKTFLGYPRADGSAGTRNLVGIISCVACANDVVSRLSDIDGAACFTHQQGCSQTMPDVAKITQVLINLALNPNLGAVLLVSLGCESVPSQKVLEAVRASGKPVEMIVIQQEGGLTASVEKARRIVLELVERIRTDPQNVPVSKLRVGLKCGSSDTTQGLSANVVVGSLTDMLAAVGAGIVIGETTEFMGAEHIAARNAVDKATAQSIVKLVHCMEQRALSVGVDMRGGQPTRGNIAGGLTTIEEKSLGALAKAGSAVYQKVIDYGERTEVRGLVMMDAPGREPEMLTGLAAAGCNLIVFSTGRGAPQGFPFVPVVKVTGNERTFKVMNEHMDLCVSGVMAGTQSPAEAAGALFEEVIAVASGSPSKAEKCGYNNSMNIYATGPVI